MPYMLEIAEQPLTFGLITLAIMLIYSCFLTLKPDLKKIHLCLGVTAVALLYMTVYLLTEAIPFSLLHIVLNKSATFMALGLVHLFFTGRWYRRILVSVFCYIMALFSEVVPEIVLYFSLLGQPQSADYQIVQTALGLTIACTFLALAGILKFGRRKSGVHVKHKFSFLQMAIAAICLFCAMMIISLTTIAGHISMQDVILLCGYLVLLALFYISFEISDSMNKRNQEYALEHQRHELLEDYYKRVEAHQNEIRRIKHDVKNQLFALGGYLTDDAVSAGRQIEELVRQLTAGEAESFTAHPGMNALLGVKYRRAQEEKIVCDFTVKLPKEIGVDENDLASLVGNVLDNAIEACGYCAGQRYIHFNLVYHNGALILASENSADGTSRNLATRKDDAQNHGFGMGNIKRTVEQYGGDMQYQFGLHSFRIEITMFEKK